MEEIKPRGRPRKARVGILSSEQVAALQTPQQIEAAEARERERLRGVERRKEAKVLESMSQAETIQDFWAESLKLADPEKLEAWRARQEDVEAQLGAMRDCMEGRAYDEEFILYVDTDTKNMLREYGEAGVTPIVLIGKFWQDPNLLAQLTTGEAPSSVFAKFGVLIGLPDLKVHQWNEFMAHRTPHTVTAPPGDCSQLDRHSSRISSLS